MQIRVPFHEILNIYFKKTKSELKVKIPVGLYKKVPYNLKPPLYKM